MTAWLLSKVRVVYRSAMTTNIVIRVVIIVLSSKRKGRKSSFVGFPSRLDLLSLVNRNKVNFTLDTNSMIKSDEFWKKKFDLIFKQNARICVTNVIRSSKYFLLSQKLNLSFSFQNLLSNLECPEFCILKRVSLVQYPLSSILYPVFLYY